MPSHGRPCVPGSSSPSLIRTPVHWVGVHAYSLVLRQSPLKGPVSTHSHILRSSGSGLQHVNLGKDTVQVTTLCPQTSSTTGFYKVRWFFFFFFFLQTPHPIKNLHTMQETRVRSSGQEDNLEKVPAAQNRLPTLVMPGCSMWAWEHQR